MEDGKNKILVVDDEEDIVEFISYNLQKEGYIVNTASNGRIALEKARVFRPHLILLDIMMPEMDGVTTCEELRNIPSLSDTLIAFLSARSEDYTQIAGFNSGADDFISKPVRPKVLLSRIKALLRRYRGNEPKFLQRESSAPEGFIIDRERHLVIVKGKHIDLPRKEFNLLELLTSTPSRVFTRQEIFDYIWGPDVFVSDRTIDVYIRKLREKIGLDKIKTIKGVGYKFEA